MPSPFPESPPDSPPESPSEPPPEAAFELSAEARALAPVLTPEGFALLNSLRGYREQDALALNERLRAQGHPPEVVAAVLTQLRLREAAAAKFGPFAAHMVFTQAGLEQATRMNVAARHAARFAAVGVRHVADLGCGLGADAMALAALDLQVTAVELEETAAAAATVNLMPFPNASVVVADATAWAQEITETPDAFWLDPARRVVGSSGSSRRFDPEQFSPPLSFVESLADGGAPVGVKLGPGLPHASVPTDCEAQWVSVSGAVTEVALWFNALARDGVRRAALVLPGHDAPTAASASGTDGETGTAASSGAGAELTSATDFGDSPQMVPAGVGGVGGHLYEPDGAVIRAGLVTDLIDREFSSSGGRLLDEHIAYFCADEVVHTPFATGYRVLDVMPYHVKGLRRWARETGVGRLDIKKRGLDVTPEELRRLVMSGQRPGKGGKGRKTTTPGTAAGGGRHATLVLTRIGSERLAIEVEPLAWPS